LDTVLLLDEVGRVLRVCQRLKSALLFHTLCVCVCARRRERERKHKKHTPRQHPRIDMQTNPQI
jgi:hypothetical protein